MNVYAMTVGLAITAPLVSLSPDATTVLVEITPTPVYAKKNGEVIYVTNPFATPLVSRTKAHVWKRTALISADANWDGKESLVVNVCLTGTAHTRVKMLVSNPMNVCVPPELMIPMAFAKNSSKF